jgi:hypothetical protein
MLIVRAETLFSATLEVDLAEMQEGSLLEAAVADHPRCVFLRLSYSSNLASPPSILEADPDVMDQEYLAEDYMPAALVARRSNNPALPRNEMSRTERARMLFERYRVPYDEVTDVVPGQDGHEIGQRVHAPIRMRVRYSCHLCNTTFRHERACRNCSHQRCDQCPRLLPHRRAQELYVTPMPAAARLTGSRRIQRRLLAERLARRSRSPDETLPDIHEMDRRREP